MIRRSLRIALPLPLLGVALALTPAGPGDAEPRTVLLESFGSVACPDCADARIAVETQDVDTEDRVVAIEYHVGGPLVTPGVDLRQVAYGDPDIPTTFFDGADPVSGGGDVTGLFADRVGNRLAEPSPLIFDAVATFSAAALAGSLEVEIQLEEDIATPSDWTIRAVFVEDAVSQCCGPGGESSWNRVVRRILTGRPLAVGTAGSIQFEQWDQALDPFWEVTRLSAVIWVQRDSDNAVLGATLAADGGGLQPLPVTGLDTSIVNLLPSRPNPLRSGQTRIPFTLPGPDRVRVEILDAAGRLVRVLTDETRGEGVHDVPWTGVDAAGNPVTSGVYFVRLETGTAVRSRKILVVRGG
jgi:hypothetical protein